MVRNLCKVRLQSKIIVAENDLQGYTKEHLTGVDTAVSEIKAIKLVYTDETITDFKSGLVIGITDESIDFDIVNVHPTKQLIAMSMLLHGLVQDHIGEGVTSFEESLTTFIKMMLDIDKKQNKGDVIQ